MLPHTLFLPIPFVGTFRQMLPRTLFLPIPFVGTFRQMLSREQRPTVINGATQRFAKWLSEV
ncbi:hypothetical protein SAHL_15405 [Salinisphaera orenii YIM 95161]|uniref:Uncharacterized protein n=1 Tax=Salinisphaera orenii YIM 95161 TaxID=1051139 RepID=A0A423PH54_9GAMM|nr:hypothetical protein SAHL_15405 [Salinisphaera halophila YIM 95161]